MFNPNKKPIMKTLKLITCIVLVSCCDVFAQTPQPMTPMTPPADQQQKLNSATKETQTQQPGQSLQQPGQPAQSGVAAGRPGTMGQTQGGLRPNRYMVQ